MAIDSFDLASTLINNRVQGLYYYWLDESKLVTRDPQNRPKNNTVPIGHSGGIVQSVVYVPYMDINNLTLRPCNFDVVKYGYEYNQLTESVPTSFRVMDYPASTRKLGNFKCYKNYSPGGARDWRKESKLQQYPFSFGLLTDYIGSPFQVIYHLCNSNDASPIVKTALSDNGTYSIGIESYKGDIANKTENMINQTSMDLPTSSTAYSNFRAQNRAQTTTGRVASVLGSITGFGMVNTSFMEGYRENAIFQSEANALGRDLAAKSGRQWGGDIYNKGMMRKAGAQAVVNSTIGTAGLAAAVGGLTSIANSMAKVSDLKTAPNTMTSMGSDLNFNLGNSANVGDKYGKLDLIRYGMTEEYNQRIGDYFALYGYKQNKLMAVNKRNRYYYNYIKTLDINVKPSGVPKEYVEIFKAIFNNGVTIWHVDRSGVDVGDYSMDNYEV